MEKVGAQPVSGHWPRPSRKLARREREREAEAEAEKGVMLAAAEEVAYAKEVVLWEEVVSGLVLAVVAELAAAA